MKYNDRLIEGICTVIVAISVLGFITFMPFSDTNHENNKLRKQVDSLTIQLKQSDARLKDVQNTLRIVDAELSDYVYQIQLDKKEK